MRNLYLRIYLTVLAALALFALVSGWLLHQHLEQERERVMGNAQDRAAAWGELLQRSLPGPDAAAAEQAAALKDWSAKLRLPLALDDAHNQRVATSDSFAKRESESPSRPTQAVRFDDGRTLLLMRPGPRPGAEGARSPGGMPAPFAMPFRVATDGVGLVLLLVLLFAAVALGAWPVVRRLTRRLEALKHGVEAFGAGALTQRVDESGGDEVAAVGASFNRAAQRIEALLQTHKSLLANASHELRSPLARMKMAVAMLEDAPAAQQAALRKEIHTNIRELDLLVEEVLLASRLDATQEQLHTAPVALLPLAAEEASRVGAMVEGDAAQVRGDERLLRRALRNLLENAHRYGGGEVSVQVRTQGGGQAQVQVCDRGPGVPEALRERIFEPFFRLPGHAEREGGVGLGLALVRQIATRHGGSVRCLAREGGGSCFVLCLPGA